MKLNEQYINLLDRFNSSLEALPLDQPAPELLTQSAQRIAKKIVAVDATVDSDLSELSDDDLDALLRLDQSIEKQFQKVKQSGGFSNWSIEADSALEKLKFRAKTVAHEKNEREKRDILQLLFKFPKVETKESADYKDLKELFAVSRAHFSDKNFALYVAQLFAMHQSLALSELLSELPRFDESELFQIGVLIHNPTHRERFCEHFGIDPAKLETAVLKRTEYEENLIHTVGEGICFGYTLSQISNALSNRADLFPSARFIQASFELGFFLPTEDTVAIGQRILSSIRDYPRVLSRVKRILKFESTAALLAAASNPTETNRLANIIGKIALQMIEKIAASKAKLEKELRSVQRDLEMNHEIKKSKKHSPSILALLESEKRGLAAQYVEISTRLNELTDEYQRLKVLRRAARRTKDEDIRVPHAVMKNTLKLEELPPICEKLPIAQLSSQLREHLPHSGACELSLLSTDLDQTNNYEAHSIYVSSDPLSFCDTNETDLLTGRPKLKNGFQSIDEMIDSLLLSMSLYYQGKWGTFSLLPYKNLSQN